MLAWMLAAAVTVGPPATAGPPGDLAVVGTIVSPRSDQSMAILRSDGRSRTVAAGERAFGGRLVSVAFGLVIMEFGLERVQLRVAGVDTIPPAPVPTTAAPQAVTPSLTMVRTDVERRLGEEIPKILAETTVIPYMERGSVAGLLVSRMPDGLLSEVGLRAGDVLQSVNEVPVDSVATLASLWPRFQNATEVRAVVLRDGQPLNLTLSLH